MADSKIETKSPETLKREFELFFKEQYSRLYYYALRYVPDEEVCKDLVSESFRFLWEHIDTFCAETALTYMYTHVYHLCIDHLRHAEVVETNMPSYLSTLRDWHTNNHRESDKRIRIIMKLIEQMPPTTRLVMEECYFNEKKYREVAEMTGLSESGIRKHIMKGLDIIRSHFSVKYKKGSN